MSNVTQRTFSSDAKTDISYQRTLTHKMIKEMKKLKNITFIKKLEKINLKTFHHNSLKNSLNANYTFYKNAKEKLKSSDSSLIQQLRILPPLELYNSFNKSPFSNRTLSINSLSSIQNYTSRNKNNNNINNNIYNSYYSINNNIYYNTITNFYNKNLSERKNNRTRNKMKFIQRFNYTENPKITIRAENKEELNKKAKKILFQKYFKKIQENEIKNIKEERSIEIDLMNLQIKNYQKMINLIKLYIESTDKYLKYLNKKIKKEKEIQNDLFEKKNETLHETYLLRHRFGRVQRQFEACLNNKFFLLCVKNKTSLFEKFSEEDQKDYQNDIGSLNILSNFNSIQKKFNKQKTLSVKGKEKRYSVLEENLSEGKKIIREPRIIFSEPEEFKKKLDIISYNIKNSLMIYNEKQYELTILRENLKEKKDLIEKDEELEKFFNEEMNMTYNKLKEEKLRNEYLKNYLKNLPKINNEKQLNLVDLKIVEIYNEINKKDEFKKKIYKFNEKLTTLNRLAEIENKVNELLSFKNYQEKHNFEKYNIIKKNLDVQNRIKANEFAKIKAKEEFQEKLRKIIEKSNKYIFKPFKKVSKDIDIKKSK